MVLPVEKWLLRPPRPRAEEWVTVNGAVTVKAHHGNKSLRAGQGGQFFLRSLDLGGSNAVSGDPHLRLAITCRGAENLDGSDDMGGKAVNGQKNGCHGGMAKGFTLARHNCVPVHRRASLGQATRRYALAYANRILLRVYEKSPQTGGNGTVTPKMS